MTIIVDHIPVNPFSRPGADRYETKALVMHWVANPRTTAKQNRDYFAGLAQQMAKVPVYASAHYVIGLEGETIEAMPDDEVAYHVGSSKPDPASGKVYTDWTRTTIGTGNPNYATIGIELCHPAWNGSFTAETERAAVRLAARLCKKYQLDPATQLARHFDVVGWKACPRHWVTDKAAWEAFKEQVAEAIKEIG